jgi:hypothetical protein
VSQSGHEQSFDVIFCLRISSMQHYGTSIAVRLAHSAEPRQILDAARHRRAVTAQLSEPGPRWPATMASLLKLGRVLGYRQIQT